MSGTNNLVFDCSVQTATNRGWGVWISGPSNRVSSSSISSNLIGIYVGYNYPAYVTLDRCRITDNGSDGVQLITKPPITLHNLLVTGNASNGISRKQASGSNPPSNPACELFHCTVADNGGDGIYIYGRYIGNTLARNMIVANNGGYGFSRYPAYADGHLLYVGYSCVYSNALGTFISQDYDKIIYEDGIITNADPQFISSNPEPYAIDTLSPCLDAAPDIGVTNDILGVARPIISILPPTGLEFDMGAWEMPRVPRGTIVVSW
jgi:parallel beta-helix repeat protein